MALCAGMRGFSVENQKQVIEQFPLTPKGFDMSGNFLVFMQIKSILKNVTNKTMSINFDVTANWVVLD